MAWDYFSIGENCATANAIQYFTGVKESYFFDSLVTPGNAFDYFSKPTEHFLASNNWDLMGLPGNEGIRVRDKYSELLFQHEFPRTDLKVDVSKVEGHLEIARSKFGYLRTKTIAAIKNSECCVLVRRDDALKTMEDVLNRVNEMRAVFLPINPKLKIVIASIHLEGEFMHPEFIALQHKLGLDWAGDPNSWQRTFETSEKLFHF